MTRLSEMVAAGAPDDVDVCHFLSSRFTVQTSENPPMAEVMAYGATLRLDATITRLNARNSWFVLLDDEAAQFEKYGQVMVRRGHRPHDFPPYERGSRQFEEARELRRQAAHRLPPGPDKAAELRAVVDEFGPVGTTSRTLGQYK